MFSLFQSALFLPLVMLGQGPATKPKSVLPAEHCAQTTRFLAALAKPMGGYAQTPMGKVSLRATLGAVRGLRLLGVEPADLPACRDFVIACLTPEGFADAPDEKPGMAALSLQPVGLMALFDLGAEKNPAVVEKLPAEWTRLEARAEDFESIRLAAAALEAGRKNTPKKQQWLEIMDRFVQGDPKNIRNLGGATAAKLRLGVKFTTEESQALVAKLIAAQGKDGGWSKKEGEASDLDTCYRVMRAIRMLGGKPDAAKLRAFIQSCRNPDGGYGIKKGEPSMATNTYQALIVLSWLE